MQALKQGIKDLNQALEEYGVAYRGIEADIRKTYFLIFQTGWNSRTKKPLKLAIKLAKR